MILPGCAGVGTLLAFDSEQAPTSNTALIRPATKEEKLEKKADPVLIVLNLGLIQRGPIVHMRYITEVESKRAANLSRFASVRVPPGEYLLVADCPVAGYDITYKLPMVVAPGGEYLLECTGITAGSADIHYRLAPAQGP
jgi:hypothetical protein